MTLNDHNADEMLKGTLMQNKPSDLFLHYYTHQPFLIGMCMRYGLRHQLLPQALVDELEERNMDLQTIATEVLGRLERMPSTRFH